MLLALLRITIARNVDHANSETYAVVVALMVDISAAIRAHYLQRSDRAI